MIKNIILGCALSFGLSLGLYLWDKVEEEVEKINEIARKEMDEKAEPEKA